MNVSDFEKNKKIDIILNQTNMSKEEAVIKLDEFNYDYIEVIRDWLGVKKKEKTKKSINQQIFTQFREKLYIEPETVRKYQKM